MTPHHIAALDIGGTKIAATIANEQGPIARMTQLTVKSGLPSAVAEQAVALIDSACAQAGIKQETVQHLGVSSCGPFARLDGSLGLAAPNICGGTMGSADLPNNWEIIPLEEILRKRFETLVIENDCVAALVAERTFGAVRDEPNCIYATWSTGIGFGLCVDGRILRGKHGNAGHAGHMLMDMQSTLLCGCGNRGDLEAMISGRSITNQSGIAAPELFAAARDGDTAARDIALQAAQWFGRALYNLAVTLDTGKFVIGGSVWNNHEQWLAPLVRLELTTRMPALTQGVSILPAALGTLSTDIGAFALVMPEEWVEPWRASEPWRGLTASTAGGARQR